MRVEVLFKRDVAYETHPADAAVKLNPLKDFCLGCLCRPKDAKTGQKMHVLRRALTYFPGILWRRTGRSLGSETWLRSLDYCCPSLSKLLGDK